MTRLEQALTAGNPIITGNKATLVWRGKDPAVLEGDFTGWDPARAVTLRRAAPGVWFHELTLPRDAYIEYALFRDGIRRSDPLNADRTSWNGLKAYNHFFFMPRGAPTNMTVRAPGIPQGEITRHALPPLWDDSRQPRVVRLYRPPVRERVPLVVVYDGRDYFRRAHLATILDNLIAQGRMRPVALAFVPTFGRTRFLEYACSDVTLAFVLDVVLPLARSELKLVSRRSPGAFGVMGASMGGLMALYTGLRRPDIFGHVIMQSSFLALGKLEFPVWDLVRHARALPARMWLAPGRYDLTGVLADNRRLRDLLNARGATVGYREANSGHNYPSWRDEISHGLEWTFGPRS